MINGLFEAFLQMLDEANWMDEHTKEIAREKVLNEMQLPSKTPIIQDVYYHTVV